VRELARASIDLIKDDELMTDPAYLPLETRVRVAMQEIRDAEQVTGHRTMYAFNITGDLAGLSAGTTSSPTPAGTASCSTCRSWACRRSRGCAPSRRCPCTATAPGSQPRCAHPPWGVDFSVWQQLARLAGADHVHASGLGSKFYEQDEEVAASIRSLRTPLGATIDPLPTLSSGQNVHTPGPTFAAVRTTDLLMLAGGGIIGHPDGPAAGVRSLRQAWAAAVAGDPVADAAAAHASPG
jgi:ribulose-bisphosphate carboxylase large chain